MPRTLRDSNGEERRYDSESGQKPKATQRVGRLMLAMVDMRKTSAYLRLLFSLDYTGIDVLLIICGVISGVAGGIPFPLLGIVFGDLINSLNTTTCSASENADADLAQTVRTKVLYVVYITIANFVSIYIYTSTWCLVSERLARRYRKRYFESIIKQDAAFIESLSSGDIISRLVSDIETVQSGTSEKVGLVISTLSYFVTSYIVAFIKVPSIAGMLVSVAPCFFLMSLVGSHFIKKYTGRIEVNINAATSIASSCLSHLTLVHAFNANERLEQRFAAYLSQSSRDALKKATTHAVQVGFLYFVAYSANALAFWEGARMIANTVANGGSGVSAGAVYTVIFVLIDASFVLSQVAPFIHVFAQAASASERLLSVIHRPSAIDGTAEGGTQMKDFGECSIQLSDVHFAYPNRPHVPVLQGMSFTIPPRKHTAIVGPSGGGKSTVIGLIERFYDPESGTITAGDTDFRDINCRYLRGNIGLVQQEPGLLDRSILENIAYGLVASPKEPHQQLAPLILDSSLPDLVAKIREGLSQKRALSSYDCRMSEIFDLVRAAAASANALSFIESLPFGFATNVGTAGAQLSGGQKQRIALARALVRDPQLLILDEATAALDSTSEQMIQAALSRISSRVTIVSIAHRLATAKSADKIVLVQGGRVTEEGSHTDLVAHGGVYADMVRLQNLGTPGVLNPVSVNDDTCTVAQESTSIPVNTDMDTKKQDFVGISQSDVTDDMMIDELVLPDPERERNGTAGSKGKPSTWFTAKCTFSLVRPNLSFILFGLCMSVVIGGSYSAEAVVFGHTVGSLSSCRAPDAIRHSGNLFGLLFFVLALVEFFANVAGGCFFGWAADKILYRTRVLSFRSLLSQTLLWHGTDGRTPGMLVTYITSDASALGGITGSTIGILLATAVNLVGGLVMSFAIAWKVTIVLFPTIPVLLVAGMMKLRVQAKFAERHQKAFANATDITVEAVGNIRTVAAYSLEKQTFEVFGRALRGPYRETIVAIAYGNVWLALAFSISSCVYALAYWWGSKQIAAGNYSQTEFFIILPALLFSTQSCGQMFALAPDISKARVASSNIVGLLTTDSAEEELSPNSSLATRVPRGMFGDGYAIRDVESAGHRLPVTHRFSGEKAGMSARLRGVHFTYPNRPERPILRGLDICIKKGQFCALVGPSGSGKSTTFAMLERFYRPGAGSVVIDDVDVTHQLGTDFRDDIALVPQENVLFEGTVAFNIALGSRPGYEPTQAEIEEVCRIAQIHEVIMELPQQYETMCSHDGRQFSGGQRQRLSIARALVRKPRLLLLDESTSALDVESEKRIQEALALLAGHTTIVAIAHRLNTIYQADQIFLIEEGRCVEQGTHEELIQRSDKYRLSVLHQSLN